MDDVPINFAAGDRVKSKNLRSPKTFTIGLTQTGQKYWLAEDYPGAPNISVSRTGNGSNTVTMTVSESSDFIFGWDKFRVGPVGNSQGWGYIVKTFYSIIDEPSNKSTAAQGRANVGPTVVTFDNGGQDYFTVDGYDKLDYPIGRRDLVVLREVSQTGNNFISNRADCKVRATMSKAPIDTGDVFGLGINTKNSSGNVVGADGRDGPTGDINFTSESGSFVETFAHLRYHGQICRVPTITISTNKGNFADNDGTNLGTSVNFQSIRFQPPQVAAGQSTTATITMTASANGQTVTDTVRVNVSNSGGGSGDGVSEPGKNYPPSEKVYGLSILTPSNEIRFQADADDAIAQHVKSSTISASSGTQYISGLTGCNNSNSIAVCAENSGPNDFTYSGEASPAMSFTSTGTLAVRGGEQSHSVSVLRIKGESIGSSGNYGMLIQDKNSNVVLDDGELGLGVTKEIYFSVNNWTSYSSYSVLVLDFGQNFTTAPLVGVRTDKNLFITRPYINKYGGYYNRCVLYAPGKVSSSGSILLMASNNQKANLTQYNDDHGLQIMDAGGNLVFDSRQRIAAVTDVVDVNIFTSGSTYYTSGYKNLENTSGGYNGIDSYDISDRRNSGNIHNTNQIRTANINGNPARDYLCMNGVVGTDISRKDFIGYGRWGLCARFDPNSQKIQLQRNYTGLMLTIASVSKPEGRLLVVRSY